MSIATRFLRPPGVRSSLRRERQTLVAQDRERRTQRRYAIARTAYLLLSAGKSLTEVQEHLRMKVGLGEMDAPTPSTSLICELAHRWEAGQRAVAEYADRPRSGRPPKALDARLWRVVREGIQLGNFSSKTELCRRVLDCAVSLGLPDPSRRAIIRAIEQEHLRLVTSVSDAAAAQRLAFAHPTVPTRHSHQCWVIDEFLFPVWVRIFLDSLGKWISTRLYAVLIIDARSRAVLSALLADPTRRRHPETGEQQTSDFDKHDVLAAIVSAACRELAPEVTSELAGYLPHVIRWDNSKAHVGLRQDLIDKAKIQVRKLPRRRPQNRGRVERPIGTLKSWFCDLKGFDERWYPEDQKRKYTSDELLRHAAGRGGVRQAQSDIAVMALMDIQEAQSALDDVVRRYNTVHQHRRLGGLTPFKAHRKFMPRDPRRGRDILQLLPLRTEFVTRDGITHRANGWEEQFAFAVGDIMLMPGRPVTFRADPLGRGIFAQLFNDIHFLKPLSLWSRDIGRTQIAETQAAATTLYDRQSRAARRAESQQIHDDAGVAMPEPKVTRSRSGTTPAGSGTDIGSEEQGSHAQPEAGSTAGRQNDAPGRSQPSPEPTDVPPSAPGEAGTDVANPRAGRRRFLAPDPMSQIRVTPPRHGHADAPDTQRTAPEPDGRVESSESEDPR